jgi:integrase/recombinase XerD
MGDTIMSDTPNFSVLLERFFTQRMMRERHASPHTIACYRDTFRLLLKFVQEKLHKSPSSLHLSYITPEIIDEFLDHLQKQRGVSVRTRNLRLSAIRSFFGFAAYEQPASSAHIQRVLNIPTKKCSSRLVEFMTRPEIDTLLAVPDRHSWIGRRDYALLLLGVQTGLRLSEITSLDRDSVSLSTGANVRCEGKGRKERCTPLTPSTVRVLKAWLKEPVRRATEVLFPSVHGTRMSSDAVQYLLAKHVAIARQRCPSLQRKRVSFHVLRHTAAMELLQAGVDSSIIALWLGHESPETTQVYLHAHMELKEVALARVAPLGAKPGRFRAGDPLLRFLDGL